MSATAGGAAAPVNVFEFEPLARARLPAMVYEYLAGGGGDERTLAANRAAFDALRLAPRVLVDVSAVDLSVELLGERLPHPVLLAPVGYQRLFHPDGELETARGAAAAGALMAVSTVSTTTLEEVARAAPGPRWFQLYVQHDRGVTRELVARAAAAGYRALCLTVDTAVLGTREREKRAHFGLPEGMSPVNLPPIEGGYTAERHHDPHGIYNPLLDASFSWRDLEWLRGVSSLPLVLKGVLRPDDASAAVERGADAIVVSNHGGRNLDTAPAAIEALPRVAEAVAGRVPLLVDGGVRRGTDVVKALALGARAVFIGRPFVWGLAAAGAEGVARVVELLRLELAAALALCGTPRLSDVTRDVLWQER